MPAKRPKLPDTDFWFGDVVFLRVNPSREPGIVTGIKFRPGGQCVYDVSFADGESDHFACELSTVWIPSIDEENTEDD